MNTYLITSGYFLHKSKIEKYEKHPYLITSFSVLLFLVLVFLIFPKKYFAQSSSSQIVESISVVQGLSHNTVHSILQDHKGFLWFATEDGLNRYDGYEFYIYRNNPADSFSLSDNFIWCLYLDSQNQIWIGTNNGGLNKYNYDTDKFEVYSTAKTRSVNNNSIRAIFEDSIGNLWVGTEGGGLNKFEKRTGIVKYYKYNPALNSISNDNVKAITEDSSGNIWIGTDNGLNKYDPETKLFYHYFSSESSDGLSSNYVWSLLWDSKNRLWIGTNEGGVNIFDGKKFTRISNDTSEKKAIPNQNVTSILEDTEGNIWISTEGGLAKYIVKKDNIVWYLSDPFDINSMANNFIRTIFQDKTGIYWIGTVGTGVNKLMEPYKILKTYQHNPSRKSSLSHNMIRSIFEDKKERIWIGTLGGGLNLMNGDGMFTKFRADGSPGSLSSDAVSTIFQDSRNIYWIGTWGGGLNRMIFTENGSARFTTLSKYNPNLSLSSTIIQAINEDKFGNLWIGTEGGLDYYIIDKGIIERFQSGNGDNKSLSDNRIQSNCILIDNEENIWVGTWNGLNKISSSGNELSAYLENINIESFFNDPYDENSLSDNRIISLFLDEDNILWIGTHGGGLNKLDLNSNDNYEFVSYSEKDGLPSNVIYGILNDNEGNLWISTNNGLSKFTPADEEFRNYDESDGLQSNQFFWGASCKAKSGRLYFGGVNGVNSFLPEELKDNPHIPPVHITGLQLFNKPVTIDDSLSVLSKSIIESNVIELDYDNYIIGFEFVALDFVNSEKNLYRYKLEGFDNDWTQPGRRRFVNYTDISDGEYVFKVQGSNNDGLWNLEGASLRIIIESPFWKTWWFIIITILTLTGLVVYLISYRVKQLLSLERLRTKIAADLHDNIGSSLTEISILSEVIATKIDNEKEDVKRSLKLISENSRELIDKMTDIVWLVNPKRDSLYDLILRLEDRYSEILSQTNISFKSENLRALEKVSLSMEHRQHIYLIFKEAINNSITHGNCTEIILNANQKGRSIVIHLRDNGIGFDPNKKSHGNGLENMKRRAEKIGGKLTITSSVNQGTEIQFVGNIK